MLQIISGRFFASDDIEAQESDAILYSNLSWIGPIATDIMEMRPADGFLSAAVSSYAVRYVNRMERGGALILADANDAVEQFRWLASFWFRAYFHPDYQQVQHACRQAPRTVADRTPPHRFVSRFFEPRLHASAADVDAFRPFVRKAISMPRGQYLQMIACLGAFFDALEVIGSNFDLAYSMLVYVLEALSKTAEGGAEKRSKLKQRFIDFVIAHTTSEFFTTEAERIPRALPRSKLEASLKTLYDARSGFVHQLTKVREQLRHPYPQAVPNDYLEWDQKPYLTLGGLVRLTHHVIGVFIDRQESTEREIYPKWRSELSGVIHVKFAPEYWIWNGEGLTAEGARQRISGLLEHLASTFPSPEWKCPDLTAVLAKTETLLPDCAEEHQKPLKWLFFLCCWVHRELDGGWSAFEAKHGLDCSACDIEGLAISLLFPRGPLAWDVGACEVTFDAYIKDRHKDGQTHLPLAFELAIMARIASLHLDKGRSEAHRVWLDRAILDAAGQAPLQRYLVECRDTLSSPNLRLILGMEPLNYSPGTLTGTPQDSEVVPSPAEDVAKSS